MLVHLVGLGDMSIISRKIDGFNGLVIGQRKKDGYVNATAMCQATSKQIHHYFDNKATNEFLDALSANLGIPRSALVLTRKGGKPESQGTWVHPQVAINLGQWCSPQFAVLVSRWVMDWMTAETKRKAEQSPWGKVREEGKEVRREFTDAIQDYIERHPELPDDAKTWMYANASDKVNLVVFGRTAKQLLRDFQVSDRTALRNAFNSKELQLIREVENVAMRLVDSRDIHPFKAVEDAEARLLIPISSRTLALG